MRDISEVGPGSPTSTVGTKGGTSVVLLRVDTILLLGLSPWICEILFGPTVGANCSYGTEVCSPQIGQGSCVSSQGRSSLVSKGGLEGGVEDLQKTL